jgi:hypothetical protein
VLRRSRAVRPLALLYGAEPVVERLVDLGQLQGVAELGGEPTVVLQKSLIADEVTEKGLLSGKRRRAPSA